MKRFSLILIFFLTFSSLANANHIKGGWMYYEYLGPGISDPLKLRYKVGIIQYIDCNSSAFESSWNFSIFNGALPYSFIQNVEAPSTQPVFVSGCTTAACYPCISPIPERCYKIITYETTIELAPTRDGYILSKQRCCRVSGINNVAPPSSEWGTTYTIKIPGIRLLNDAPLNSSPKFIFNDTVLVCNNAPFTLNFGATDLDGDQLVYSFCDAYHGGDRTQAGSNPVTASTPPYNTITYTAPYSGTSPLGAGVTINSNTGVINGIAPPFGEYIICVCVKEFRNGVLLGESRKEIHLRSVDCNPITALLLPKPATCDGFTVNFANDYTANPAGTEHLWTFGEPSSGNSDTSILATPSHTYADTGVYTVKLKVSAGGGLCSDSASFQVRVFPGFFPDFTGNGSCFSNPFQFTDGTTTNYGLVNSWRWLFGDETTLADTSRIQNPQWTYSDSGPKTVSLVVGNSKGCVDTIQKAFTTFDKPPINLAFRDTLICNSDSVSLIATGVGTYSWTPNSNMIGANTNSPKVAPTITTLYYVDLEANGCVNNDSVQIRVVDFVTLQALADTTICQGDTIQLGAITDGLQFNWTPPLTLDDPSILNPLAITNNTTTYQITATIGSCMAIDDIIVTTVPYPVANAGVDQTICYNSTSQLNGATSGSFSNWSPVNYLNNPFILNPISTPPRTTNYTLFAYDTLGCPKPGIDSVTIFVNPKINANAGRDTIVVVGQPLQFNGSGGSHYLWTPPTGLSNPSIANPIGVYGSANDTINYKLLVMDDIGCADSAFVSVSIFKTIPYIFVPTAFTPNNDGLNDILKPVAAGMQKINNFSIYNRWGQLVFTSQNDNGWDGRINGQLQGSGVFVWMISAVDFTGKPFFLKGTVTLIR